MKAFPKKYKIQDLHNRAKKYKDTNFNNDNDTDQDTDYIFSTSCLPIHKKLSYRDFFTIYMKDFFNCKRNIINQSEANQSNNILKQLFLIDSNPLENVCSAYEFFNKKNQSLQQVGTSKLERRIASCAKKTLNINNKILESYLSTPHKIYIPDSDVYLYIIQTLRSLWNEHKIINKPNISYWSFNLQTSIPPQNISRKEEKIPYYTLKYFVGVKCEALPVCVQDIDLCCGDVALLVHPKDKRYNKYIGKNAIIPLCNRQIPIIGDENVNIAIDNGIKRVCPCADQESIELAKKYNLPTDIYVFNNQGLYTQYIHEPAFIGQERNKYYNNITGFIEDIGNLAEKGWKTTKIPYLDEINERLVPYKIEQFIIDLKQEKQNIINQIFEKKLKFSFLDENFGDIFEKLDHLNYANNEENNHSIIVEIDNDEEKNYGNGESKTENTSLDELELKQKIIDEINQYLPDSIICNSQLPFGWRMPIIKNADLSTSFFDIENLCLGTKDKPIQTCFNFVLLHLIIAGALGAKNFGNEKENKLCEYNKFFIILSQNEKKIQHFVQNLSNITGEKTEYSEFLQLIQNLDNEENSSTKKIIKLIENSKFIQQDGNRLTINIQELSTHTIDSEFINLCITCYLCDKNIKIDNMVIFNKNDRFRIFKELLIQELILGKTIYQIFSECSYEENNEFLGNTQLTKFQIEQSQRDLFSIYGENPIRLNLLTNMAYNQKEILLNNIFLKQVWNAARLCIQKDFLPENIQQYLHNNQDEDFEDFDLSVLYKLNELYKEFSNVESYTEYTQFFDSFRKTIQDIFFSRYIEIQKVQPTKHVQFVCSYFFNFLLTVLYPLVPEFVDALQYISNRKFLIPIQLIPLKKSMDYNMNILLNTFIRIKNIKLDSNIKQHEACNIFIKSNPSILDIFTQYEQIFKTYFHIGEIIYVRIHEQNPLGYDIFSDDNIIIGIKSGDLLVNKQENSIETIERDIKNLQDKLDLLRQRIQLLPEGEQRTKTEEDYAKTKEEIENLTIKYSLLNSK